MRVWLLVGVLAGATMCAVSARAQDATPPPPIVEALEPDSITGVILGVWIWDAEPRGRVTIHPGLPGTLSLEAAGRFLAVGLFDGRSLVGLVRWEEGRGPSGSALGVIRGRYFGGPDRLEVEFAGDLEAPTARREIWSREESPGEGPPGLRLPAPDPSLPKLGEFVYVEELPEAIEKVPPDYPSWAREQGVSGTVLVQALIGRDGRVKETKVVRSIPELDDYAVAAVKQWRFKPARAKNKPVAVWVAIPIKFTLR